MGGMSAGIRPARPRTSPIWSAPSPRRSPTSSSWSTRARHRTWSGPAPNPDPEPRTGFIHVDVEIPGAVESVTVATDTGAAAAVADLETGGRHHRGGARAGPQHRLGHPRGRRRVARLPRSRALVRRRHCHLAWVVSAGAAALAASVAHAGPHAGVDVYPRKHTLFINFEATKLLDVAPDNSALDHNERYHEQPYPNTTSTYHGDATKRAEVVAMVQEIVSPFGVPGRVRAARPLRCPTRWWACTESNFSGVDVHHDHRLHGAQPAADLPGPDVPTAVGSRHRELRRAGSRPRMGPRRGGTTATT